MVKKQRYTKSENGNYTVPEKQMQNALNKLGAIENFESDYEIQLLDLLHDEEFRRAVFRHYARVKSLDESYWNFTWMKEYEGFDEADYADNFLQNKMITENMIETPDMPASNLDDEEDDL